MITFRHWVENLAKAIEFGTDRHKTQTRLFSGAPYFTHLSRVASIVKQYTQDEEIIMAAYLHDTVEDTKTSYEEIEEQFGPRVAALVKELTNVDEQIQAMGKPQYHLQKMTTMSDDALLIKLADKLDNTSGFDDDAQHVQRKDPNGMGAYQSFVDRLKSDNLYVMTELPKKRRLNPAQQALLQKVMANVS